MLAGNMNNDNYIDLSSDSDGDFDFDSDDPVGGSDQQLTISSSRPTENRNDQYRTLPPSFTNGRHIDNARHASGSSSYRGSPNDSTRAIPASNRTDIAVRKHNGFASDENDNGKRILPSSFSNDRTMAASGTRKLPPSFSNGNSQRLAENRMGKNVANGVGEPSSSRLPSRSSFVGNNQKVITDNDNEDVYVYGSSSSHRVLPPSFGRNSSVNQNDFANGIDMQGRPILENRIIDSDERAVYQEALQNISQDKREDDLPEGVLSVPLLKHQGLGKTVSTIALIQKQRAEQSKFMSVDSDRLKAEALNLDEEDEVVPVEDKGEQSNNVEPTKDLGAGSSSTAAGTGDMEICASQMNIVPDITVERKVERKKNNKANTSSTTQAMTRPAAVYHGGSRTRDPNELAKYDVVITTYTIVANEVPKQNADDDDQKNGEESSAGNKRKQPSNARSKSKKKKKKLKDSDIYLASGPVARVRWFRVVLDEAQTIKNFRTQVAKACCGLRAKRRWCLSGTPIQNAIDELYSYFRFLKYDPYSTYTSFCTMIKHPIARNAVHGYKKLQTVLRIVLLRRTKETMIDGQPIINLPPKTINLDKVDFTKEERNFYLTLEERSRQQFKAYAAAGTLKQNYANILLMLLRLRQACDHPLLVKGHQSEYKGDGSIEMAKQLPKEMIINLLAKLEVAALCSVCNDPPEDAVVAMCGHVFCYQCIYERITTDENMCPSPNCGNTLSTDSVFSSGALRICISGESSTHAAGSSSLDDESSSISQSSYISSKIQAAIDILNSIINTYALTDSDTIESNPNRVAPVKAIVFSQWTGMLDLLELSLNSNLIQYRRLDGTMSLNLRDKAVKDFNTDPEVRVMIMSLKAGNLGLNMVAACHVILLDLWWNPYAEDQAVDRAHRIGQTRAVTVSRLTIKDTVEDRILALQEEKRAMVSSAFGEDKSGGHATRLTVDDLKYLFRM
uniref:RING-type domain-containing protein n=1 Tax=Leersia perrieri TaxID=77586 RepID=A0A0D9X514_9ORYZ